MNQNGGSSARGRIRQKMVPLQKTAEAGESLAVPKKAKIANWERKVQSNLPPLPGQKI